MCSISEVRVTASIGLCYGGIELLVLARMGSLYCRLAIELPTQARQLEAGDTGAAHGAAQGAWGVYNVD